MGLIIDGELLAASAAGTMGEAARVIRNSDTSLPGSDLTFAINAFIERIGRGFGLERQAQACYRAGS